MGDRTMLRLAAKRACAPLAQSNLCSQTFVRGWCSAEEVAAISGKVKWFDVKKGFGFIIPDDGSRDVFVHQTEIHAPGFRSLADGESVEYKVSVTDDGRMRAVDLTGPDGEYVQGAQRSMSHDDEY